MWGCGLPPSVFLLSSPLQPDTPPAAELQQSHGQSEEQVDSSGLSCVSPPACTGEHPLSRWVCWKGVGEVGKGQMEHRRKFTSDALSIRKLERDGEGGDQNKLQGEWKVKKLKKQRKIIMQRKQKNKIRWEKVTNEDAEGNRRGEMSGSRGKGERDVTSSRGWREDDG